MARHILDDVKDFLDHLANELTSMHVRGAAVLNSPGDRDAVDALTSVPAGLIEQAQGLSAQIEKSDAEPKPAARQDAEPKPKAKAKPHAKPHAQH